tara:strand:+ start:961 stop:1131 length:171 start_codon:yes stop_codon:yes gene_type:complete
MLSLCVYLEHLKALDLFYYTWAGAVFKVHVMLDAIEPTALTADDKFPGWLHCFGLL